MFSAKFNLKNWDKRKPIAADTEKPWGEYHVFQDFNVSKDQPLPRKILQGMQSRFQSLLELSGEEIEHYELISELADPDNDLAGKASADEKILVVEPKQPGYHILSMQYHGRSDMTGHIEVWEFLTEGAAVLGSDTFKPYGWSEEEISREMENLVVKTFTPADILVILPGQWHALAKPAHEELVVVREWRITPQSGKSSQEREDNIIRTYDNAGRGTLGPFPVRIMLELARC